MSDDVDCSHSLKTLVEYVERPCGETITVWECCRCYRRWVEKDEL